MQINNFILTNQKEEQKMGKYKILIIEDDPCQIAWAKQCLNEHELTFAESEDEFYEILYNPYITKDGLVGTREKTFDFAITDLFLPIKKGESTSPIIGKGIFESCVGIQMKYSEMKGCALFSNYEHHVSNELSFFKVGYCGGETIDTYMIDNRNGEWEARKAFVVIDMLYDCYSNFLTKEGEIITLENLEEKSKCCGKQTIAFIREESIVLLKPYERILDCLLSSL